MGSAAILQLNGVTKQFPRSAMPAVSSVSLSLQQGETLALLGPSGCGKTTLLRLIAGFEQPDRGTVAIADDIVAGEGYWVRPEQRGIGMVFQDYALFPHLSVAQNVAFGLNTHKRSSQKTAQRIAEVLTLVGLEGLEKRYPHQLSGGQQQRVALARALAPCPFLVLLDEPLSNLDVQVRLRLRQELREILKAAGTTAIFVTHDQEEALSIADRVGVMQAGQLEQFDLPEVIYQKPASRFVAEFVTQANFLPAERNGSVWQTEIGAFPINAVTLPHSDPTSKTIDLMVRQEELEVQPHSQPNAVIVDRQFLGREQRYCLKTAKDQILIARTTAQTILSLGTPVQVTIAAPELRGFPIA